MSQPDAPTPGRGASGVSRTAVVLVVIGVAGALLIVLAAIVFPSLVRAREWAARSTCIANMKSVVNYAKMYADDHRGVFPDIGHYSGGPVAFAGDWTEGRHVSVALRKGGHQKANNDIYRCPKIRRSQPWPSYAWNRHLSRYREDRVQFPTATPMIWDWAPGVKSAPGIPLDPGPAPDQWGYYPSGAGVGEADMARACSRHMGGLVLAFADGHAMLERPTRWTPRNPGGRFMACDDKPMPWPPEDYRGIVLSMYPDDPMQSEKPTSP